MGNRRIVMPVGKELEAEDIRLGMKQAVGDDLTVIELCLIGSGQDAIVGLIKDVEDIEFDVLILHTKDDRLYNEGKQRVAHIGAGEMGMTIHGRQNLKATLLVAGMTAMMETPRKFEEPIPYRMNRIVEMLPEPIAYVDSKRSKHNKSDFGRNKFDKKKGHRPRY